MNNDNEKFELRLANRPKITYPDLPISQEKNQIIAALQTNQVIIVAGETGSGKTTQLPKIAMEAGLGIKGMIGHTQPRRIAARTIAMRIAAELQTPLGSAVGFKVRFSDRTSQNTYIKLMTDGILLSELQNDRWLNQYDCLIIDEAHERSLNIDFLLGFIKLLLAKRHDLKVIITSATIDVQRFAQFFDNAPVIEVKGRTFPVEVHYLEQETSEQDDPILMVADAVEQACSQGPGDILVFQSGEKEIREVIEVLTMRKVKAMLLPLYARLSVADQQKVFQNASMRKIVVTTNVAETSLTVPNIRFVVDSGMARISRYNYRNKLQRLPIEPISQANAEQRKGRCGRVGPGICYRLYTLEDLSHRSLFTEPEILRTHLAGVLLKMLSMRIKRIEAFPFLDPPDSRYVKDGFTLLYRIGAVDERRHLTIIGRQLANIPIEPKLGRVIIAANQFGALKEILIIVSALSIVDPKERPAEFQAKADLAHSQFQDENSDFIGYINLWHFIYEQKKKLSHQQFRKLCRQNFLSYLRVCEWFDIHEQLEQIAKELNFRQNQIPADYSLIHKALLTGLIDSIGLKDEKKEYTGARNSTFYLHPSSSLFKKSPLWVVAFEIIHTTKTYARVNAKVEPQWVEEVAGHLLKRQYVEPHFEQKEGRVVAYERATLLGLEIVNRRRVSYEKINPVEARQIFIQEGLVAGFVKTKCAFYHKNKATIQEIESVEDKIRKQQFLVDDRLVFQFYDARLREDIYSTRALEQWLADKNDDFLIFCAQEISSITQNEEVTNKYPTQLSILGDKYNLEYKFDTQAKDDGVTLSVPVESLKFVKDQDFSWVVPGFIEDKILALLKNLPKKLRTLLMPLPQTIARFTQSSYWHQGTLFDALQGFIAKELKISLPTNCWESVVLDAHLKMHFKVIEKNKIIANGDDLLEIYENLKGKFAQKLSGHAFEKKEIVLWDFGDLPKEYPIQKDKLQFIYYPALVDNKTSVAIQLFESLFEAQFYHRLGLARLYFLQLSDQIRFFKKGIASTQKKALAKLYASFGDVDRLLDQILLAASYHVFVAIDKEVRDKKQFDNILGAKRNQFLTMSNQLLTLVTTILTLFDKETGQELLGQDFIVNTPLSWLKRFPVYLKTAAIRREKFAREPQKDKQLMAEIQAVHKAYASKLSKISTQWRDPEDPLLQFRWRIEELRVSLFAQSLGTVEAVSKVRLLKLLDKLG